MAFVRAEAEAVNCTITKREITPTATSARHSCSRRCRSLDSPDAIFARSRRRSSAGKAAQPHYAAAPCPMLLRRVHTAEVTERQAHLDVTMPRSRSLVAWRFRALRFIETFDDTISLQPGEPIDPEDPIELIDLVLETYGEQTFGLFDLFHTAQILVVHPHTGMAFDLFRYAPHGDAAFFVPDHVGGSP